MTTRVLNAHLAQLSFIIGLEERGELVRITRPSKWGSPFTHLRGYTSAQWGATSRDDAIAKHEEWLIAQPELMRALPELRGKYLCCVCVPQKCHGHTLARYAETYPKIRRPNGDELVFEDGYVVRPMR